MDLEVRGYIVCGVVWCGTGHEEIKISELLLSCNDWGCSFGIFQWEVKGEVILQDHW